MQDRLDHDDRNGWDSALLPCLTCQQPDPGISSHSNDRGAREENVSLASTIQSSASIAFPDLPFPKASHMAGSTAPPHHRVYLTYT